MPEENNMARKKKGTGFGVVLKRLRQEADLSQAALAERAGMNVFGVAKIEQGIREPGWGTVLKLAAALSLRFQWDTGADNRCRAPCGPGIARWKQSLPSGCLDQYLMVNLLRSPIVRHISGCSSRNVRNSARAAVSVDPKEIS